VYIAGGAIESWLTARGTPHVCDCTLFRDWGIGASGRWRAWSGPDRNGLKVPMALKPWCSGGVRRGDSGHERAVLLRCI